MGRQRAFTDIISYVMSQDDGRPEQQRQALVHWCTAALEICRDELVTVDAELRDEAA